MTGEDRESRAIEGKWTQDEEKETPEGKWNEGEEKGFKRVKAGEMGRTAMMERMCEIKKKQSEGRDGQIWTDNMKQQQRERRGRETRRER